MPPKCTHKTCGICKRRLERSAFVEIQRTDAPGVRLSSSCRECQDRRQAEFDRRASLVKFCECGCGRPTNPAPITDPDHGWVIGEPMRFLKGHSARTEPYPEALYVEEDCGYETPCWIWQFKISKGGYGRARVDGREIGAHRMMFEKKFGPLPEGWVPDHLCRNPSCVNPDHMRPLTFSDNSRWKITTRLDWDKAEEIRALAGTMPQWKIAEMFGVSQSHISRIVRGMAWDDAA